MAEQSGPAGVPRRRVVALAVGAVVVAGAAAVFAARRPQTAPDRTVDLVRHLDFGYLPDGVRRDTWYREPDRESISGAAPRSTPYATLNWPVPAPGGQEPGDPWIPAAPADQVAGRPTWWRGPGGARTASPMVLRWEQGRGRWAEVVLGGVADADNVTLAGRVAAGARFDLAEPVRLPVRSRGPVGGLRPRRVRVEDRGGELWSVSVTYAAGPPPSPEGPPYPSAQVRVAPMTELERFLMGIAGNGPNTTVDGHAARQGFDPPGEAYHEFLKVWDVDGLLVVLDVFGTGVRDLLAPDGAAALYRALQLVPDWR